MKRIHFLKNATCILLFLSLVIFSFTTAHAANTDNADRANSADPNNMKQVVRGKIIYDRFCAFCHGINLKGQKHWRTRKADGRLPAPPHDESGHTWHHADNLLFGITKFGLVPPYGPKNYESDMPAWESTLKDADIWATLAYIKSRWPEKIQKLQKEITEESLKRK